MSRRHDRELQAVVTSVLEDKLTATVDADGATAIHTLKAGVRINNVFYSAGMSIAVLAQQGKPVITRIGFNANQFVLMSGSGDTQYSPFAVINGQVFMNDAFIQKASIDSGKISDYLQSDDYVVGRSGMRIGFRTGSIEINGSNSLGMMKQDNVTISIANASRQLKVQLGYLTGVF
ncbi:DUF1983 domain-containing protein [Hafnia alvei]|nr:DUF1983 domain-containing protein [Hafnia alvei]